jgi:hypothetical protein
LESVWIWDYCCYDDDDDADDHVDVDEEKMLKCYMMVNKHTWTLGLTANQIREE